LQKSSQAGVPQCCAQKTEDEYEMTRELLHSLSEASSGVHGEHLPGIPIEGNSSHIDRGKDALLREKVRY
jgi:hypothetical protein